MTNPFLTTDTDTDPMAVPAEQRTCFFCGEITDGDGEYANENQVWLCWSCHDTFTDENGYLLPEED